MRWRPPGQTNSRRQLPQVNGEQARYAGNCRKAARNTKAHQDQKPSVLVQSAYEAYPATCAKVRSQKSLVKRARRKLLQLISGGKVKEKSCCKTASWARRTSSSVHPPPESAFQLAHCQPDSDQRDPCPQTPRQTLQNINQDSVSSSNNSIVLNPGLALPPPPSQKIHTSCTGQAGEVPNSGKCANHYESY